MAKHRSHSIEFKRQVAQEFLGGETLHGLANRHNLSRNLIRIWVERYEAGAFDEDAAAADLVQAYEARIAALERLVGKQALELEFLKGGATLRTAAEKRACVRDRRPRGISVARGCKLMAHCTLDLPRRADGGARRHRAARRNHRHLRRVRSLWLAPGPCRFASARRGREP